jgi:hypothetical protein
MADDNTITPIEYVLDGWVCRDDVAVWYGDNIVSEVLWHDKGTYTRRGYNVYLRGNDRGFKADTYSHCLRVEPKDDNYLREQITILIEAADNEVLLDTLEDLRQSVFVEESE